LPILENYYGAHTGRPTGGEGLNLTNLPSRDPKKMTLRKSLRAPDGYVFVAADSSQIEARVVAYLAGQKDLVEAFRNGADIYSDFASDLYGYPVNRKLEEVREDGTTFKPFKKEGDVGKQAILGLGFGMGEDKFGTTVKVETGIILGDKAGEAVQLYRAKYLAIKELWGECEQGLHALVAGGSYEVGTLRILFANERVHLPNGLFMSYPNIRYTEGRWADGRPKRNITYDRKKGRATVPKDIYGGKGTENCVQALARVIVFDQMVEVTRRDPQAKMILNVYDENVACVPIAKADAVAKLMEEVMSTPPAWAPDLPVACEVSIAPNYAECK
jgi:DNA polymerase